MLFENVLYYEQHGNEAHSHLYCLCQFIPTFCSAITFGQNITANNQNKSSHLNNISYESHLVSLQYLCWCSGGHDAVVCNLLLFIALSLLHIKLWPQVWLYMSFEFNQRMIFTSHILQLKRWYHPVFYKNKTMIPKNLSSAKQKYLSLLCDPTNSSRCLLWVLTCMRWVRTIAPIKSKSIWM